jgi:hypothetical protein
MANQGAWPRRQHGALEQLAENIWQVNGPAPGAFIQRTMTVVRDEQRRLLLHSAIALDAPGMDALQALGTPTWLVVPNGWHRLDAPAYKHRYPDMLVVTPEGAAPRVSRVVAVDLSYAQLPAGTTLRLEQAPWPDAAEGVVHVASADGTTLIFNDLVWTPEARGWRARLSRWLRQSPQVPIVARHMHAPRGPRLRAWLERLAQTPGLVRVIPGHGPPITAHASQVLARIAQTA